MKRIKEVCEVCKKAIKKAMYWNPKTKRYECGDCYLSDKSLIK